MHRSTQKTLVWHGISLLCYLAGLVLFLVVAGSVFLAPPEYSLANLRTVHTMAMLAGVALIVVGKAIGWHYGLGAESMTNSMANLRNPPEQSKLEELGYRVPKESPEDGGSKYTYEDGTVYTVCSECGARNENEFKFCNNCSAELPE